MRCAKKPVQGYSFFRDGVLPEWESTKDGGHFVLRVETPAVAAVWLDLLLACIGGAMPGVVGVRAVAKTRSVKLEMWHGAEWDDVQAWLEAQTWPEARVVGHKMHAGL